MEQEKRKIAIVCGGDSSEHDVSLRSAQGLYSFFDKDRYEVFIVAIKGLDWNVDLGDGTTSKIDLNDLVKRHSSTTHTSPYTGLLVRTAFSKAISNLLVFHIPPAACL